MLTLQDLIQHTVCADPKGVNMNKGSKVGTKVGTCADPKGVNMNKGSKVGTVL